MIDKKIKKKRIIHCSFLQILFGILENPQNSTIISWNETGDRFSIYNRTDFIESVLPKYYRHQKFTSFTRQLNFYGFQRQCCHEKSIFTYQHPQFNKTAPNLLLKRKPKIQQNFDVYDSSQLKSLMSSIKQNQQMMMYQVKDCIQTNDNMTNLIQFIINHISNVKINQLNQAKSLLSFALNIIFGMSSELQLHFKELFQVAFPSNEVHLLENILNCYPCHGESFVSHIYKYLCPFYPSSQFNGQQKAWQLIEDQQRKNESNLIQQGQL